MRNTEFRPIEAVKQWCISRTKTIEVSYTAFVFILTSLCSYIIDNYHFLSNVIIFSHSKRYQWHNDDPLYDGQRMLSRLQIRYIREQGYVNLRCVWTLGCPSEIRPQVEDIALHPQRDPKSSEARHGWFYRQAFETLFPGEIVPATVAASCCAQLAVTGEKVRERPKSDYERYRQWLLDTTLKDDISGRILEYSWHSKSPGQLAKKNPTGQLITSFQSYSARIPYTAPTHHSAIVLYTGSVDSNARSMECAIPSTPCRDSRLCHKAGRISHGIISRKTSPS